VRLRAVVEDAVESGVSPAELAQRVNRDIPRASAISPLLQHGGTPLAAWLTLIATIIGLLLAWRAQVGEKPITPEQIEHIVQRAIQDVEKRDDRDDPPPRPPVRPPDAG